MREDNPILVGKILNAHGIKGHVEVLSFTNPKTNLCSLKIQDSNNQKVDLSLIRTAKNNIICKIPGIEDRNAAEALKNTELYTAREDLPALKDDEFYIVDLINRKVIDTTKKELGIVNNVYDFGSTPIIEIAFHDGTTEMISFRDKFFPTVTKDYLIFIPPVVI